ncbi:hypothetical protein [Bacillus sp. Marseille-P3800]|uniref:hypothetical protein n=1 Tax=Bacillus sp. Marseille-P3800 TaxID=2014782 RepID=UPI00159BE347|nr:hypothetical protein [Bacillus sp. Marseille-P3800]
MITVKSVKCTYTNGDTVITLINGSIKDARDHFLGQPFNFGTAAGNLQECISVEQIL